MNRIKKILPWTAYCLGTAVFVLWLVFSTSWIAGTINGESIREVDFASIRDKYQKDYVYYVVDSKNYEGGMYEKFSINGWAFCETEEDNSDRYNTLILNSNERTYELIPYSQSRSDVGVNVRLQLDRPDMKISRYAGFIRQYSLLSIKDGVYDLYICCWENETNHGMTDTFCQIVKNGDEVEIVSWSTGSLAEPVAVTEEKSTLGYLDAASVAEGLVSIRGWEFVQDMDSAEQSVYVELTDLDGKATQYPTKLITRSDVANSFDNQRYAQSGYMTSFPEEELPEGETFVRVLVENGGDVWRSKPYSLYRDGDEISVRQYVPWRVEALEEPLSPTKEDISLGYLDAVTENEGLVSFYGWEFAWDMDSAEQSVYVELTDQNGNSAQYPAEMLTRSDVADGYDDQRYAQSGYITTFENAGFNDGTYTVHVLVENGGEVWRSKPYTVVKAGDEIAVYQ